MKCRDYSSFARTVVLQLFLSLLVLSACNSESLKSAPIGDHAALEQLATAYRSVAEGYPMQPASMRPAGKKEFVERVFTTAGYHYTATLKAMAKQGVNVTNQDHRDLAELLMLPYKGLADTDMATLYSAEELVAIQTIQASLK